MDFVSTSDVAEIVPSSTVKNDTKRTFEVYWFKKYEETGSVTVRADNEEEYVMYSYEGKFGEHCMNVKLFRKEYEAKRFVIRCGIDRNRELKYTSLSESELEWAEESLRSNNDLEETIGLVCDPGEVEYGSQEI